jgi:hypothetical protein
MVGVYPGEPMFIYYQQFYNRMKDIRTPYGITVNGIASGNHYSVQLTIDRFAPCTNLSLVAHCVLTENGLEFADKFNWVERLMVPDENGTHLNLAAGQQIIPLEFDVDPSWVRDSLSLVAFIQDGDTRRVLDAVHLSLTNLYPLAGKEILGSNAGLALQISPNPFRNFAAISFHLLQPGDVSCVICDLHGRVVRTLFNRKLDAGPNVFTWDGDDDSGALMPPGTYFCRILTSDKTATGKIILLK